MLNNVSVVNRKTLPLSFSTLQGDNSNTSKFDGETTQLGVARRPYLLNNVLGRWGRLGPTAARLGST